MQNKHLLLITWSCLVLLLQSVQARVANAQDALVERSPENARIHVIGKRQNLVCVNDAYFQALENERLAIDLCGQIIGSPSVTVVVDSTPVMYGCT